MVVEISPFFTTVINLMAFAAFVFVGLMFLYVARNSNVKKKIPMSWVNVSIGTFMIGLNYLVQATFSNSVKVMVENPTVIISSYLLIIAGVFITFISFFIIYRERSNEMNALNRRHDELKSVMERLKKKFLSRDLPEGDLMKLDADILRELTEIEVKLDKFKKK